MGNQHQSHERSIPEKGYKIISISNNNLSEHINLLTDYIISPDPKTIDLRQDWVKLEIYSILNEETRTVQLSIKNRELGIQLREDEINTCILRVVKIFAGSPLEKNGVKIGEFIVGLLEGGFNCIKSFAQLVTSITMHAPKSSVSIGVCGEDGKTRIVCLPVTELKEWQSKGRGLLGCELAEGWIHKWKPSKEVKLSLEAPIQPTFKEVPRETPKLPKLRPIPAPSSSHSDSSDEIDKKCDELDTNYNESGILEIHFKGILKNEEMDDASTLCKCKPLNKICERCFIQKEENYYFYNHKKREIVTVPIRMMLKVGDE